MICRIVSAEVTNNKDPDKMGRIKFKSDEFLSGKEHPAWVNPGWPNMYKGSGIFTPTDIGSQIKVLIPVGSDDAPMLFFPYPTETKDIPKVAREEGYYLKRAMWKFKTLGYLLFDLVDKVITILSTEKIHLTSVKETIVDALKIHATSTEETTLHAKKVQVTTTEETAVDAPAIYLGALTIDDEDKGVVRKEDLQKAIDDLSSACNAKFDICEAGRGIGHVAAVTAESSEISYTE